MRNVFWWSLFSILFFGSLHLWAQTPDVISDLEKQIQRNDITGVPVFVLPTIDSQIPSDLTNLKKGRKLFLDIEPSSKRTIFSKPGFTYKNCDEEKKASTAAGLSDPCEALDWPGPDADLTYLGDMKTKIESAPETGERKETVYVHVRYDHRDANNNLIMTDGWMIANPLSTKPPQPIFNGSVSPPNDPRPKSEPAQAVEKAPPVKSNSTFVFKKAPESCPAKPENIGQKLKMACDAKLTSELDKQVSILKSVVGECPLNPPDKVKNWDSRLVYDQAVIDKLMAKPLPKLMKENHQPMSRADLIDIDAMARSIYAEMAKCYDDGIRYPLAVARIFVNRSEYVTEARKNDFNAAADLFSWGEHDNRKSDLAKVATQSVQISCWNKKMKKKNPKTKRNEVVDNVSGLTQSLCPPVDANKKFWNGVNPGWFEQETWDQVLKMATDAVLHRESFKEKTNDLKDAYFYASGNASIDGLQQISASVGGQRLEKPQCIKIYSGKDNPPILEKLKARKAAHEAKLVAAEAAKKAKADKKNKTK